MLHTFLLTLSGLMALGSASLSYPVFGTKRYARANLLPSSDYGSSLSMPMYQPPIPQYYDQAPQYMPMPSYPMSPAATDYYDDSSYYGGSSSSSGNTNNNNYYYVPPAVHRRHQRQDRYPSYGLPTYLGEYKPTPYYYAHAPSYSYSDDRESNNPLDDLHEEMLQEDEREQRARDFLPIGQEQWYQSPSRHQPDNTFLRNLIMYNNQLNSLRSKQPESSEDYEEYEDAEPEYYDTAYTDNQNSYNPFLASPYSGNPAASNNNNNRNALNKINNLRSSMAKNAVEDDEEVQELKSLIHQQKNSRHLQQQQQAVEPTPFPVKDIKQQQQRSLLPSSNNYNYNNDYQQQLQQQQLQQQLQLQQQQQQQQQYGGYSDSNNWQRDSPSYGSTSGGNNNNNNYEYDNEYEDDSWSHWDRKRNVQPKKLTPAMPIATTTTSTAAPTTTTSTSTTTAKPKVEIVKGHNGQKEVVLPRPAVPVRNPFANLNGLQKNPGASSSSGAAVVNMVAQAKPGKSSSKAPSSGSVYDTIKKIINMQQSLEDAELIQQLDSQRHPKPVPQQQPKQKRFVASTESLVQQLDGLKRTA